MYCPKCGKENPEGVELCQSCSWVLKGILTAAPSPDAKTSGFAITALVLMILSFFTFFLTALPAIIFGIVALFKIEKSGGKLKGKGMAIAGIAVPVALIPIIAILMGILMPALAKTRYIAYRMVCATNESNLGKAMMMYANDYKGKYPTSSQWCDLLIEYTDANERTFQCKGSGEWSCNYAMNKNIEALGTSAPPDMVLVFESKEEGLNQAGGLELVTIKNHGGDGCNVLFNDGHVEYVKKEDVNNLMWEAEQ